jgi:molybdopterin-guanine dinucleotide biosynthesis protein A
MDRLGILLAGGRGTRLQAGAPKALAMCAGRTLLARALATLESCCDRVRVVAPAKMALPIPRELRVDDPPGGGGPLPALAAALGSRRYSELCVLSVDLPLLSAEALKALQAKRETGHGVAAWPGGRLQPLAIWLLPEAGDGLLRTIRSGEQSATRAVEELFLRVVEDDELATMPGGVEAWLNVNTPEELAQAEAMLLAVGR